MSYFKIPEDGSALLGMTSFDTGTAFISFLCSEPQLSPVSPSYVASTSSVLSEWLPSLGNAISNFEGHFKTRLLCWGKCKFWKISTLSKWSFLLPSKVSSPHDSLGGGCSSPALKNHVITDKSYHYSLKVWLQKKDQCLCKLHCTLFIWCFLAYTRINVNTNRCAYDKGRCLS